MAKSKSEEFNERMKARLTSATNGGGVTQRLKASASRLVRRR